MNLPSQPALQPPHLIQSPRGLSIKGRKNADALTQVRQTTAPQFGSQPPPQVASPALGPTPSSIPRIKLVTMRGIPLLAVFALPAVSAYSNTFPAVAWSSHSLVFLRRGLKYYGSSFILEPLHFRLRIDIRTLRVYSIPYSSTTIFVTMTL